MVPQAAFLTCSLARGSEKLYHTPGIDNFGCYYVFVGLKDFGYYLEGLWEEAGIYILLYITLKAYRCIC